MTAATRRSGADEVSVDSTQGAPVQLVRRVIDVDGRAVGVARAGHGVPLVMVHGFGVESLLYAQSLGRLVGLGFEVIAIDIPGHGDSDGLHMSASLTDFVDVLDAAIRRLGIRKAVLMGHSMGGRLVTELAARTPNRSLAVVLLDPIVGQPWDELRTWLRWFPPALAAYGAFAVIDVLSTLPTVVDGRQALKIGSRVRRSAASMVLTPWNGLIAGAAVLRSGASVDALTKIRIARTPCFVVHADRDLLVPQRAAEDTRARLDATYISVHDAGHSWMVRDPEALPAIMQALLQGRLGTVLRSVGLETDTPLPEITAACFDADIAGDLFDPIDVLLPNHRQPARLKFVVS